MAERTLGKDLHITNSERAKRQLRKEADARRYARHLRTARSRERQNGLMDGRKYRRDVKAAPPVTRPQEETKAPISKVPKRVQKQIEHHMQLAESSSTIQYIPQIPGVNTRFLFQSPAERKYKQAIALAAPHDQEMVKSIRVRAANRFRSAGNHGAAFEWAKASGDQKVLGEVGMWAAQQCVGYALHIHNKDDLLSNERRADYFRQGIIYAIEAGHKDLAKEIGVTAIRRHIEYGDSQVGRSI